MRKAIAIDFDGCLCTDAYPDIGQPNWYVINRAKQEQQNGAGLILWTCREDQLLLDAIAACECWGLTFDAVNESLPDWIEAFKTQPRKVGATEYWDDKSVRMPVATELGGDSVSDKPLFNADAAEEYFGGLCACYHALRGEAFRKENEGRHPSNPVYSAEYQKFLGMELALKEVLEFFSKFDLGPEDSGEPLTLKDLREMDGEPVWVADLLIPKCSCYHFVQKIDGHPILLEPRYYPAEYLMVPHYCADDENQAYGETWLAYRRKPEVQP